ncbi:ENTH domain-containing protein 1 [Tupaia chinensis]|uniref:ENTH domain-containing protein 1 n=1 Tax=Tupaia chinensis TaxID=246437 RepID=UPI0003C90DE5|nr:ENTH domain-containing protein 1 [Tupaia chinensis]
MAFRRQVKNFVKNYSDAEIKVREATSNDPWGPSSSLMLDISDLTFNTISLSEIMNMLWHRLNDHGKNWRHVYKSLTLMDYLIKNGSKKVIQHCREGFYNLQILKDFQHIDEAGKDQGHYIREKSKQVITLLMDEQLLYKEREVACRTRRRTSYSMTFPKRLPGTENASKAVLKQDQYPDIQSLPGAVGSQETLPLKINTWKSTEDLMLFYDDDDPKPLLPAIPTSVISSNTWLSEGEAEVYNLWDADALPTPSENSPSLQTNVSLDKTSDGTITNTVIENPSQTPLEKQLAAKSCETLTTLPALWPLSKEEFMNTHLRISKSDSTFSNHASVETLYVSPSFKTFDPAKETPVNKNHQKPTQPSIVQKNDENFKTLTTWVSTTSEGTSSFSTLSMSSPESASPEKSVHLLPPVLARPSFWTLSQQQLSSASFEERDTTTRVHHLFASRGPLSFDEEENDNFNLEILPDNSDSAKKKTNLISSSNWIDFSTQNVDQFTAMSCSSFQTTKGLPREPEANNSIKVLLQEVKNAIVKLHEDLSVVIQELKVINSHLVNMSGNSRQRSQSLPVPPSSKGSSDKT